MGISNPLDDAFGRLSAAIQGYTERYSWTDVQTVYLGDGNTPPTIVVPPSKRDFPGAVYVHKLRVDNREVFQVINNNPAITYGNQYAGTPVEIGKPEGKSQYYVKAIGIDGLAYTGGVLPSQIQAQQTAAAVVQIAATDNTVYLVDNDGAYLVDNDGAYLVE